MNRDEDTSEEHIRARLPRDGQIHHLRIEFRGGVGSYRRGVASTSLIAPAAPSSPTTLEMVASVITSKPAIHDHFKTGHTEMTPTFQFGQAFTGRSPTNRMTAFQPGTRTRNRHTGGSK